MVSKKILAVIVIVVIMAGALLYYESQTGADGNLKISVADTPALGISAVYLTFNAVEVHSTGGNNSSGWKTYSIPTATINIYGVTMTNPAFLSSIALKAGKYTQIRLELTRVTAIISGSNLSMTLKTPFALVVHTFNISAHSTTTMVIDFTLNPSSMMTSSVFTPVVGSVQTS
jgi:hypothetical protein